ncbi:MAG: HDOD domain-containing protein [Mariprofundaceae bacterium]|nr:HDOD domain-containing protein [Mariprofundaceae bacterium]
MTEKFSSREESLSLIQDTQNIPTLPDRFLKIREITTHPHSNSDDLSAIIETDLATASTLLKIANSASYNPHGRMLASLSHAIARLGVSASAEVAMSMSLLQIFITTESIHRVHALWAHAYAVGILSKHFYQRLKTPLTTHISTVFMMCLLHDVGQVILTTRVDQGYFDRDLPSLHSQALCDAEQSLYGIDHAEVGALILEIWNMPDILIQSTLNHHKTSDDSAHNLCKLAELFVQQNWPNLRHIEEVHQLLHYSPADKIDAILQASPAFQKYLA